MAPLALLCLLVFTTRVEAFGVYLTRIAIHTTAEYGGVPEIYIACNSGTSNAIFKDLPDVNVANRVYVVNARHPAAIFDRHLGLFEKHYCGVYESDTRVGDYDRENNVNDIFGIFTISRSDFRYSRSVVKHLPGGFTLALRCYNC